MKTLQLQGLEKYNSPKTKHTVVVKGQIITVNDADAEYMTREGTHEVVNSMLVDHWKVLPNGTKADYCFATEEPTESAEELAAAAEAAVEVDTEVAKPKRGGQRQARTPRARAK